jgi:hypothetical protein
MRADPMMLGSGRERLDAENYFTRDPLCVRALAEQLDMTDVRFCEPCAGRGDLIWELEAHGAKCVVASDLYCYPDRDPRIATGRDFLEIGRLPEIEAIVTNPPFRSIVPIVRHALEIFPGHVWILARHEWMSAQGRRDGRAALLGSPRFRAYIPIKGRPVWHAEVINGPRHNFGWYIWGKPRSRGATPQLWI